jgi:hypothetical protein
VLDKILTGFIWVWVGAYALVIVYAAGLMLYDAYSQGLVWYWWAYLIFWVIPKHVIFGDGVVEGFGRLLWLSPAIVAWYWRERRREKMKEAKNGIR